ncbi:MAG: carbonic anhydrase [Synergistota bacterium]|nr:carbonic anhydrase [Synergistota bacterium]
MKKLVDGYEVFLKRADRELYGNLCGGQWPHTLVIGCSDSRVIPEEIFSAKPGDLFVIRNVGNICRMDEPSVAAAVEYAVCHLHVDSIAILAHADCGAVKAAGDLGSVPEPGILKWLGEEKYKGATIEEAVKKWGIKQKERLDDFPLIKDATEGGALQTILLYFDLASLRLEHFSNGKWRKAMEEKENNA